VGARGRIYQEFVNALGHKPLRTGDSHFIARLLGAGENDLAVPGSLQFLDLAQPSEELAVIEAVDTDNL
jgi:hypothetical protein